MQKDRQTDKHAYTHTYSRLIDTTVHVTANSSYFKVSKSQIRAMKSPRELSILQNCTQRVIARWATSAKSSMNRALQFIYRSHSFKYTIKWSDPVMQLGKNNSHLVPTLGERTICTWCQDRHAVYNYEQQTVLSAVNFSCLFWRPLITEFLATDPDSPSSQVTCGWYSILDAIGLDCERCLGAPAISRNEPSCHLKIK